MRYLAATLHTLGVTLLEQARTKLITTPERGSETIEKVLWAVAVIGLVGAVVAALRAYIQAQVGNLR